MVNRKKEVYKPKPMTEGKRMKCYNKVVTGVANKI